MKVKRILGKQKHKQRVTVCVFRRSGAKGLKKRMGHTIKIVLYENNPKEMTQEAIN